MKDPAHPIKEIEDELEGNNAHKATSDSSVSRWTWHLSYLMEGRSHSTGPEIRIRLVEMGRAMGVELRSETTTLYLQEHTRLEQF